MGLCIGCPSCVTACTEEHSLPSRIQRRRVGELEDRRNQEEDLRYFLSSSCNHCLDPACVQACPAEAYRIRPDGIVQHQPDLCLGCTLCTSHCPYGAPVYNPAKGVVTKCDLCASRMAEGESPACVEACPTGALRYERVDQYEIRDRHLTEGAGPGLPPPSLTRTATRIDPLPKIPMENLERSFRPAVLKENSPRSLLALLTLSQLGAGLALWEYLLRPFLSLFTGDSHPVSPLPPLVAALSALGGLFASAFHPGKRERIVRAWRGWSHSPLSREGAALLLFGITMAGGAWLAGEGSVSTASEAFAMRTLLRLFGGAGVVSALLILLFQKGVYNVYSRPTWSETPLFGDFFLTSLVLSLPLYLLLSRAPFSILPSATGVYGILLGLHLSLRMYSHAPWRRDERFEIKGSLHLYREEMKGIRRAVALTATGALLLPAAAALAARGTVLPAELLLVLTGAGAVAALLYGVLHRHLFFSLAIPFTIPGFSSVTSVKTKRSSERGAAASRGNDDRTKPAGEGSALRESSHN